MAVQVSPKQALVLYYLLFTGKEPLQSQMLPPLDPRERKALVDQKLIEIFKNPRGSGQCVRLADKGWSWAEEYLGQPLSKSQASSEVLQCVLHRIAKHLLKSSLHLHDIVGSVGPSLSQPVGQDDEVRRTYLQLTGGEFNVPIRLAELGKAINKPREAFLDLVRSLNSESKVFLTGDDDPQNITENDELFMISLAGFEKYKVAFKK